jgi:hypothetical protein
MTWFRINRSWIAAIVLLALVAGGTMVDSTCSMDVIAAKASICNQSKKCCCGLNETARRCMCQRPVQPAPSSPAKPQPTPDCAKCLLAFATASVAASTGVAYCSATIFERAAKRTAPRSLHSTLCVWHS